jgi:Protein of unknown function (DUF2889)
VLSPDTELVTHDIDGRTNDTADQEPRDEQPLHRRIYDVDVYRVRNGVMRLRGSVRDDKPPHLHFLDDPDPMTVHHMVVDLIVDASTTEITDVVVVFEAHPHTTCPLIIDRYESLIGTRIGRGFSARVKELFGGPHGCTHTNALLLAMAPAFTQSRWSLQVADDRERAVQLRGQPSDAPASPGSPRRPIWTSSVDTCHVWAADGERVTALRAGGEFHPPKIVVDRAEQLGLAPETWRDQFQ